ncbi:hypothetical protein C4585_03135 [Candidatus Parcubacteria bacterium]|nr:MAG: hypothetical protein C4585_03135 [Candidatus Parcubacteria bacterium]
MKQLVIGLLVVLIAGAAYMWWQGNSMPQETVQETTDPFDANETPNQISQGAVMEDGVIPAPQSNTGSQTAQETKPAQSSAPSTASVTYNGTSYSPQTVTIKKGGTVSWSSTVPDMWVASAQHPTHTTYSGTSLQEHCADGATKSFDQCGRGTSYSFKFDKVGTWNYHDHVNASARGTIIVVE